LEILKECFTVFIENQGTQCSVTCQKSILVDTSMKAQCSSLRPQTLCAVKALPVLYIAAAAAAAV
jgi:hypothetical protein